MRFKSRSRALIGSALAASLGLAGLALSASPAMASEVTETNRVAGATRYGTASAAAATAYPDGATNVVLASGEAFPDALAAGGLAGTLDAPILLTPTDTLDDATVAGLEELGAENVTIVGGTAAVSTAVEEALEDDGYTVDRVAGTDRYKTAALIAGEVGGTTAVLANGLRFPDALAISPGAHALELPLLLTPAGELNADSAGYIDSANVDEIIIVGGTAAVSQAVEDDLEADGITVTRLAGADRYATSVEIAEFHVENGFSLDELVLATGEKFADALSGGPMASQLLAPLVLTQSAVLTPVTAAYITENCDAIDTLYILGGVAAITDAVEDAAADAAQCGDPATNQTFNVAGETQGNDLGIDGRRTCIVSGLTPVTGRYDVALFPSENVRTADDGTVTFVDANGNSIADAEGAGYGEANAITSVGIFNINGANTSGAPEQNDVVSIDGNLFVTLVGLGVDDVTLVVFEENPGFTGNTLDLAIPAVANNNPKAPREAFGAGCRTLFANEADGGAFSDTVASTDKTANLFTAGSANYFYDANDTFQINGVPQATGEAGLTAFEARLSPSDGISGTYATDPAGVSTFNLTDAAPLAPAGVLTATVDGTTVTISFAESDTPTADSYNIYRILRPANGSCPNFNNDGSTGRGAFPATATATRVDPTPGSDSNATLTYVDSGLAANSAYCYAVTTVDEGDESPTATQLAGTAGVSTTLVNNAPTIQDVRARDMGIVGLLDAGDIHQFIFSEPMNATTAASGLYRVQDADGTVADIQCGAGGNVCVLQPAGTYNGTAYAANQVMRVQISTVTLAGAPFLGTVAGVQYPVTITNVNASFDDAGGAQLDLAGSPDKVINVDTITPAGGTDVTAPNIAAASASATTDQVTLTYSEAVDCDDSAAAAAAFGYTDVDNTDTAPTAIACNGTTTVVLTFVDGVIEVADGAANINYTDEAAGIDANDILDLAGNQAGSPDNRVVTVVA